MRMHADPVGVDKRIVVASLDVGDPSVYRTPRARLLRQRDFGGDLVRDQRMRPLKRFVTYTLCERPPAGTGLPLASTGSTISRSSVRCIPEALKHPIAVTPASEVPHMFATGACQISSAARRVSTNSGSALVIIPRGSILSRPARASPTKRASIEGYVARVSPPTAFSPETTSSSGRPTLNLCVSTAPVANVSETALVKCV